MKTETSPIRPIDRVDRDGTGRVDRVDFIILVIEWVTKRRITTRRRIKTERRFCLCPSRCERVRAGQYDGRMGTLGRDVGTRARAFVALI